MVETEVEMQNRAVVILLSQKSSKSNVHGAIAPTASMESVPIEVGISYSNSQHLEPYRDGNSHTIYRIPLYYLPPGKGDIPAFTPAEAAGTRFSDPGGTQG